MPHLTPRQIIAEMHGNGASTEAIQAALKTRMNIDVTAERIDAAKEGKRLSIDGAPAADDTDISIGVKQPVTPAKEFTDDEASALLKAAGDGGGDPVLTSAVEKLRAQVPAPDAGSFLTTINDPPKGEPTDQSGGAALPSGS